MPYIGGGFHEEQAWDSYDRVFDDGDASDSGSAYNANYYHSWLEYRALKHETAKAYLIEYVEGVDVWVAKKLVRELEPSEQRMLVHMPTFCKILETKQQELLKYRRRAP